jgi:hypothetical protein
VGRRGGTHVGVLGEDKDISSREVQHGRDVVEVSDVLQDPKGGCVLRRVRIAKDS